MKRTVALLLALSLLLLGGCRTRLVDDPARADTVLLSERVSTPKSTPTLSPTPAPTPTPTPSPTPTAEAVPSPTPAPRPSETPNVSEELLPTVTAAPSATERQQGAEAEGFTAAAAPVGDPEFVLSEKSPTAAVYFDGGSGRMKSRDVRREVAPGDALGPLPTPLREGYGFNGWFTAPEGGDEVTAETAYAGEGDWILYAQWTYDPYEFWSFTLRNRTQQIYLCQQVPIYFETQTDHVTARACSLITATGSQNVAENREDAAVTDEWVKGKKPQVVLKEVSSFEGGETVRQALAARFPDQKIVLATPAALGGDASAICAGLALAKELYPDWYEDVDLSTVMGELKVEQLPIAF